MELYEAEQEKERTLEKLEARNPDDLVVEENVVYAAALLKDFFQNKRVLIDPSEEVGEEEPSFLRGVEVQDNNDSLYVKYENTFEIEADTFTETLEVSAKFGQTSNGLLAIQLSHINGSWLYFKRVAKDIQKLFAYCRK